MYSMFKYVTTLNNSFSLCRMKPSGNRTDQKVKHNKHSEQETSARSSAFKGNMNKFHFQNNLIISNGIHFEHTLMFEVLYKIYFKW